MTTEASQNDPRLPRAVREQMRRVNSKLEAKNAAPVAAIPPDVANAPAAAVTDPDSLLPEHSAAPATPAPVVDPRENDPAYWRQRFNVTQGMLRTQQVQHGEQLAAKDLEITELKARVQALEAGTVKSPSADAATFFTPEQIERFGEDQCQAMAHAAITAAQQQAQALIDAEVKPIKDKAAADAQTEKQRKAEQFWEKLTELFPRWEEVNKTDAWLAWLAEDDEASGLQRQAILSQHRSSLNAAGVATVFKAFEKSQHRPAPPVAPARTTVAGASPAAAAAAPGQGYPTEAEKREFYKRASTIRNPRDPRFVTDKERAEFEARLKSRTAA
jgi:hypothetical protein